MTAQARQLVAAAAGKYGDLDITAVERPYREGAPSPNGKARSAPPVAAALAR